MQDANYNVLGMADETGILIERYEYTPYGQRQVYTSSGLNDPQCYAPISTPKPWQISGIDQPYSLNPIGHQGLYHDQESGLVYNRARMLNPTLGRFMQRDPLGYVDGMNAYEYVQSNPIFWLDSLGLISEAGAGFGGLWGLGIEAIKDWVLTEQLAPSNDISKFAKQKYVEEVWDNTNGTLRGLTRKSLDLGDLTGTDHTFNERSRKENECFAQCIGNLLASSGPWNILGAPINPFGGVPLIENPFTEGFAPSIPTVAEGLINGTPATPGIRGLFPNRGPKPVKPATSLFDIDSPHKTGRPTSTGRILGDIANGATFALFAKGVNDCWKKCFCD